jgi:short-subunit dehydrogenase
MSLEEYKETISVNFLAYVHLTKLFLEREKSGHIVNMCSIGGMSGMTSILNSDYAASKSAIAQFSDSLRQEL